MIGWRRNEEETGAKERTLLWAFRSTFCCCCCFLGDKNVLVSLKTFQIAKFRIPLARRLQVDAHYSISSSNILLILAFILD